MRRTIRGGRFLADKRARCAITQAQLAKKMRVDPVLVSLWENGRRVPVTTDLHRLAAALSMTDTNVIDLLWLYEKDGQ